MAIAGLVVVLVFCIAGVAAIVMQIRCIDAAREVARLASRNDGQAMASSYAQAPPGAAVELRRDGNFVVARVIGRSPVLPGIVIVGEAFSALEPAQ